MTFSTQLQQPQPVALAGSAWYMDSGANYHLTTNKINISNPTTYLGNEAIMLGNGITILISHYDNATLC